MDAFLENAPKSTFHSLKFLSSKFHDNIEDMILNSKT